MKLFKKVITISGLVISFLAIGYTTNTILKDRNRKVNDYSKREVVKLENTNKEELQASIKTVQPLEVNQENATIIDEKVIEIPESPKNENKETSNQESTSAKKIKSIEDPKANIPVIQVPEKENEEKKIEVKEEDKMEKPLSCFDIVSDFQYSENIYYQNKKITLDASCSKNARDYFWYSNGVSIGAGKIFDKPLLPFNPATRIQKQTNIDNEVKLVTVSENGLVDSNSKIIKFREVPKPTICFNQESSEVKTFELGKEYTFDASCSVASEENPITKYIWKFRDGGLDDAIKKEGVLVQHLFSKGATTFEGPCYGPNTGLEVKLSGNSGGTLYHYCIEKEGE